MCSLSSSCENYPQLWTYSFQIKFTNNTNYIIVPLASFAVDNNGVCDLYVESYGVSNESGSSEYVILGSMFMQQVVVFFEYFLKVGDAFQSQISMTLSNNYALSGSYIGSVSFSESADPFPLYEPPNYNWVWYSLVGLVVFVAIIFCICRNCSPKTEE